jgi:hypothetical protein
MFGSLVFGAPRLKEPTKDHPFFVVTEGTTLVYKVDGNDDSMVVTKVERKADDQTIHVSRLDETGKADPAMVVRVSKDGVYLMEESGQKYDPPWLLLKTPATADEKWESKTSRPDIGRLDSTTVVGKPEEISVPAGTFIAVPVFVNQAKGIGAGEFTYWFAPDIGWVRIVWNDKVVKELKSVTPAPKK